MKEEDEKYVYMDDLYDCPYCCAVYWFDCTCDYENDD